MYKNPCKSMYKNPRKSMYKNPRKSPYKVLHNKKLISKKQNKSISTIYPESNGSN